MTIPQCHVKINTDLATRSKVFEDTSGEQIVGDLYLMEQASWFWSLIVLFFNVAVPFAGEVSHLLQPSTSLEEPEYPQNAEAMNLHSDRLLFENNDA